MLMDNSRIISDAKSMIHCINTSNDSIENQLPRLSSRWVAGIAGFILGAGAGSAAATFIVDANTDKQKIKKN